MDEEEIKFVKKFGKHLKKQRESKGFSTRQFAYEAGISHSTLGRLESGTTNPTLLTLLKVAAALQIDMNTLTAFK